LLTSFNTTVFKTAVLSQNICIVNPAHFLSHSSCNSENHTRNYDVILKKLPTFQP